MSSSTIKNSNNAATTTFNEDAVSMLTVLGFSTDMATEALQVCDGNVEAAANYLLTTTATTTTTTHHQQQQQQQQGGGGESFPDTATMLSDKAAATTTTTTTSGSSSNIQMIHGPISQYSVENGKSACTCMALQAAHDFLKRVIGSGSQQQQQQQQQQTAEAAAAAATSSTCSPITMIQSILDASFLQNVVLSGVATYQELMARTTATQSSSSSSSSTVEHLSAEEVLKMNVVGSVLFPGLKISGEIRQGVLSYNRNDKQGLKQILLQSHAASSSSSLQTYWGCFLITKPPETVLVCLPPSTTATTTPGQQQQQQNCYVLIDTHPRPHQFHAENAYARLHASMDDLVTSLEAIFPPVTDLGPDIPPLMAAMYNSFDVYGLALSKDE